MKPFMTYRQLLEALKKMDDKYLEDEVTIVIADGKNDKGEWHTGEVLSAESLDIENNFSHTPAIMIDGTEM